MDAISRGDGGLLCGSDRFVAWFLRIVSFLLLSAALTGCAAFSGYPKRASDPEADLVLLQPQIGAAAITACLERPSGQCRNKIIGARMYATDILFSEFEEALFRQTREGAFGTTLSTLGLTSAAAMTGGGAGQVFSGIAAFIIGGREAYQKEVLAERTVIAIHTAMRAKRAQVALRLRQGLGQTIANYPLESALGDLNDYYHAGTVLGALVGITESVGVTAQQAETALQSTIAFKLDSAGEGFYDILCGGDPDCPDLDAEMAARIRACWPSAGVPANTLMVDFVLQEAFERERELVLDCLGL